MGSKNENFWKNVGVNIFPRYDFQKFIFMVWRTILQISVKKKYFFYFCVWVRKNADIFYISGKVYGDG